MSPFVLALEAFHFLRPLVLLLLPLVLWVWWRVRRGDPNGELPTSGVQHEQEAAQVARS